MSFTSTFKSLSSILSGAGVSATSLPNVLGSIGSLFSSNPNKSTEIQMCAQLLSLQGDPPAIQSLVVKLETTQGLPVDTLPTLRSLPTLTGTAYVDAVMQIESMINAG